MHASRTRLSLLEKQYPASLNVNQPFRNQHDPIQISIGFHKSCKGKNKKSTVQQFIKKPSKNICILLFSISISSTYTHQQKKSSNFATMTNSIIR